MTRRSKPRLMLAAAALIALVFTIPAGGSGAYWTVQEAGDAGATETGTWCAVPDPATNERAIRLADIPQSDGAKGGADKTRMAIIPVANNVAWGGGSGMKRLGVRLHSCRTEAQLDAWAAANTRITAWSNSTSASEVPALDVEPTSRLNPTSGYGLKLQKLARWGVDDKTFGSVVEPPHTRRFSWILASGRNASATAAFSGDCTGGPTVSCKPTLTPTSTISKAFKPNDWGSDPYVSYFASTYAVPGSGGWARADVDKILKDTTLDVPDSNTNLSKSTNGNHMQWVVIEWWGATPSTDMIAEIVLE